MVKQADLDSKSRNEKDIKYLLEKRERLLQTLLILMGLIIASPIYGSTTFPDSYYIILFVFILSTVFLYSDWLTSRNSDLAFFLESTVASCFSFSLIFPFAYKGLFESDILTVSGHVLLTFVILATIHIKPKKEQTKKIITILWYFYTALIVFSIYVLGVLSLIS
jgi:O-antigen/teichoic acid export membrane protein